MTLTWRPLGTTGLQVPPLCWGLAELGNMVETFGYGMNESDGLLLARAVFSSSIAFADTAAAYGDGESERRLGLIMHERGGLPTGFVLTTKADRDFATGVFDGAQVRRSVERSLHLLGLDRLAICYLHDPEYIGFAAAMAPHGPVATLCQLQQEGLITHIGVAGGPTDMLSQFVQTGLFSLALSHNRYTLLNQEAHRFWDVCHAHGVADLNAAPYGSGMLAKGPRASPRYMYQAAPPDVLQRAAHFEQLCQRHNVPLAALALQFSLRDPRITSTIVGVSKPERLQQTVQLAQYPIPPILWQEVERIIQPTT